MTDQKHYGTVTCPHCNAVTAWLAGRPPHIVCPECGNCMGCDKVPGEKPSSIRLVQKDFDPAPQCGLCEQRQDAEERLEELLKACHQIMEAMIADSQTEFEDNVVRAVTVMEAAIVKAEGGPE